MASVNNPAGRLYHLLQTGKQKDGGLPAVQVWAEILNVPDRDKSQLLRSLGQALLLPSLIKTKIERLPNMNHAPYLVWLPKVESAFSVLNLKAQWQQIAQHIDDTVFHGLAICDEILSREHPEKTFDEEDLRTLQGQVRELIDDVRASGIDHRLKTYMLRHLDMIDRAIQDYKIHGAEPLERAVEATVGSVIVQEGIYRTTEKTETGSKFWKLMRRVALLVSVTSGVIKIGSDTIDLLDNATMSESGSANETEPGMLDISGNE